MATISGNSPAFIRRAARAILRRLIAMTKRVASPSIRGILAEGPQQKGVSPTARAGDDALFAQIAQLAPDLVARHPNVAEQDAISLELARLIAPKLAAMPGNPAHDLFYANGLHLLPKHFYLPIPDDGDQLDTFWTTPSQMVGVDTQDAAQVGS